MILPKVKGKIVHNQSLSKYSWFGVGGNAETIFFPTDIEDLQNFLKNIKNVPITIIGGGSNLLIRDGGIDGIVIILKNTFKNIELNENYIKVDCGVLNSTFFEWAKNNEIAGFEFLGTIPGTIGGAIRGNAGCYNSEIKDNLIKIEAIDFLGNMHNFTADDFKFSYRKNNLPNNLIFLSATFEIKKKDTKENIEKIYKEMILKRHQTQPQGVRTCGSTFKNLPNYPAWKVIKDLNLQNVNFNGAIISEKHANFIINKNSTANNIEDFINEIIKQAKEKLNINLELEIKIIGKR